jgi:hypothetical protein
VQTPVVAPLPYQPDQLTDRKTALAGRLRKYSTPRRFENGGIVDRFMKTGQGKDGKAVWIYFNDLAGRGVFSSILVVNRDAKAAPEDMTGPEKQREGEGLKVSAAQWPV